MSSSLVARILEVEQREQGRRSNIERSIWEHLRAEERVQPKNLCDLQGE